MEKIHLASSDISNFLKYILTLYISGSKEENCSSLLCIMSKIDLIMVSEQERKVTSPAPGALNLARCGQKYVTKTSETKTGRWKVLLFHEFENI